MKAVIISSGDGTKLRPLTCSVPHCMLPVMGRPIIEHILRLLHRHNITDISIISTYLTEEIKKHFSFNPINDMNIDFSAFDDLQKLVFSDDLLLISDSIVTDTDLTELISVHTHSGSDLTAVTMHSTAENHYGVFCTDKDGFATEYNRFPDFAQIFAIQFMGIAIIKKGADLADAKSLQSISEKFTKNGQTTYCYTPVSYIRDISDFDSYHRCCRDFMDKKIRLPFPCEEKAPSVWIEDDAVIMQGAVITPPVYVGSGSMISKGSRVEAYTQILKNVTLECYSNVKRSVVMDNSVISGGAALRGAIVGKDCMIGEDCAVYEGSIVGFSSRLGNRCTVRTAVHIWPDKFIDDDTVISENITWENIPKSNLLIPGKAEGVINRDLTVEFAVQLARAFTSLVGKKIAVSCEEDGAGQMIKSALIAGIQSGGGKAYDMGEQPLPITRSGVKFYSLDGGISLSVRKNDSQIFATLDIMDARGINLDGEATKKLGQLMEERIFGKGLSSRIPNPEFLYEYKLYYLKKLINSTSKKPLGMSILIHTPSPWAKELLKSAAKDLNCTFKFTDISASKEFLREIALGEYDFGAICDYRCESLTLVTKSGYILTEFDYSLVTSLLVMKLFPSPTVFVPESCPDSAESIAKKYGAEIIRTTLNPSRLMSRLSEQDHKMLLHQFIYRFDAIGSVIILLDSLYQCHTTLEELLSEIPPSQMVETTISIPKKEQSPTIKRLYEMPNAKKPKTEDAVKLSFEKGWVMIVGDKEHSLVKIISHSQNKEYAREIADICIDDISKNVN